MLDFEYAERLTRYLTVPETDNLSALRHVKDEWLYLILTYESYQGHTGGQVKMSKRGVFWREGRRLYYADYVPYLKLRSPQGIRVAKNVFYEYTVY